PALRPMGDIDVLIPEGKLEQAIQIVEDMGFRPEQAWAAPELRTGLRRLFFFEANFDGGMDAKVHLELHWSLVAPRGNRYSPDIRWFWDGTRQASLAGQTALVLTATRNVLFLAAHLTLKHLAFKHGEDRTRLLWYHDLHWVIEQEGEAIDWEEMLGQAVRFGWQTALLLALEGTQERFDTRYPHGLLERLERQADRKLMRRLEAGESQRSKTRFALSLEDFEHMRWSTRWWVLWCLAFPEKKYMLWRYDPNPAWLWPLWYFYRWFDILADGAKTIFRRKMTEP
ncbi:MAG: nucleotidyltransferase family protein, partial [Anaerolineales bacterium]|nr:nucleotidyltransferase family protein [Anaerolineales bacterium]